MNKNYFFTLINFDLFAFIFLLYLFFNLKLDLIAFYSFLVIL